MTNENVIQLPHRNKGVKIRRRLEFARAFHDYPMVLRGLAREAGLGYPGEKTVEREQAAARQLASPAFVGRVGAFLSAQFAVQVIRTRARMEAATGGDSRPLEAFAAEMVEGLAGVMAELDGFSIQARPGAEKALVAVHSAMASTIFDALMVEAQADDFDEGAFWPDVFRGLADTDDRLAVLRGLTPVILDRLDQLRHVFRAMTGGHALDLH
jgi:hypothetical protein